MTAIKLQEHEIYTVTLQQREKLNPEANFNFQITVNKINDDGVVIGSLFDDEDRFYKFEEFDKTFKVLK